MKNVTLIGAGAGSGKTYRLAEEVFAAVSSGRVRPDRIILTTFTRKAASELRARVTSRLIARGQYEHARQITGALIGTVHSICAQLLQEFAFDLGLAIRQTVLDEEGGRALFNRAIAEGIPTEDQYALHRIGETLELEDWRDTIRILADLVRINCIDTTTLPSWAERSVISLLDGFVENPNGKKELQDEVETAISALRSLVNSEVDKTQKTKDAIQDLEKAARELAKNRDIIWKNIQKLTRLDPAKKAQEHVIRTKALADRNYTWPEMRAEMRFVVTSIFSAVKGTLVAYEQSKREIGAVDYTDMEKMFLEALEKESVRKRLTARIDMLMVDEFQDTSPIQMAIFLKLIGLAREVIWVGDPKQAIFGFRGTDPELMHAALRRIMATGKTDRLPHSWRSRPELVEFVNNTFGGIFEPQGQKRNEVTLQPTRKIVLETPALESWVLAKIQVPGGRSKQDVGTDYAQIASQVKGVLEGLSHTVVDRETSLVRPIEPGDIAILVRANDTSAALAASFRALGIPVEVAIPGLLQEPEVVWLRSAMDLLLNPKDALKAAHLTWLSDVSANAAMTPSDWLTERIQDCDSSLDAAPWATHPILQRIREASQTARSLSPEALVQTALELSDAVGFTKNAIIPRLAMSNIERIGHLASQYSQTEADFGRPVTATGFLTWLDLLSAGGEDRIRPIAANAVQICTYHAAKGLEWPMVILYQLHKEYEAAPFDVRVTTDGGVDLDDPLKGRGVIYWPYMYGRLGKANGADFSFLDMVQEKSEYGVMARKRHEEEMRLLYVAMTRARDYLVFAARPGAVQALGVLSDGAGGTPVTIPQDDANPAPGWVVCMPTITDEQMKFDGGIERQWISYKPRTAKRPGRVSPSSLRADSAKPSTVTIGETECYGDRLKLGKSLDMARLGTAVHAYFAVDSATLDQGGRLRLAEAILNVYDAQEMLAVADLVLASDSFYRWIANKWPGSKLLREVPLHAFEDGIVTDGIADLLIETPSGIIIIDHKTFPGSMDKVRERAAVYAPQLAAYRRVVEAASKRPVLETGIHMPVVGLYIPVMEA